LGHGPAQSLDAFGAQTFVRTLRDETRDLDVASAGDDDEDLAVLPSRGDGIGQGRLGVDAEPPHIDRRVQFADGQACLGAGLRPRSEEHTSELQSRFDLVCRLLLEKKKIQKYV